MNNEELLSRYRELQDYVRWSDEDAARVHRVKPLIESRVPALIDDFYAEIKRHPDANKVFIDDAQVARLKGSLKIWIDRLFEGPYDGDYVLRRWEVGRRHVEVGLDHIYAAAALSRLRQGLVLAVRENWPPRWGDVSQTIDSLRTLIDLDLAIIEDSYALAYQERLQRGERLAAIGQIAGGVAHELRNPLNVVKTSAYFLLNAKSLSAERVKEHLNRINRQVNHASDVITALSSFAKPPAPQLNSVSVIECVKGALERYPPPQGIQLNCDLPDTLPKVNADATQLGIVFGNLIRNACDAMPSGGMLTLSATSSDGMVEVRVMDTGIGIEPENLAKITEPLFSTKAKGMGLGLAITHAILSKISGKLRVTSGKGQGSTFLVRIPIAPEASNSP
jgi:two-component system, NtrC family, sensor kinase